MRTKKVNRYWCDFCNKAGLSASAMRKHEAHCTLNPKRECRVCKFTDGPAGSLQDAIAALPDPAILTFSCADTDYANGFVPQLDAALPELRRITGNCPACMMAALRQKKIPVPMLADFSYSAEMKEIWDARNQVMLQSRENYG